MFFIFCFSSAPPDISLSPPLLAFPSYTQLSHQTTQGSSIPTVIHFSLTSKICFENGKTPSSSGPTLLRSQGRGSLLAPKFKSFFWAVFLSHPLSEWDTEALQFPGKRQTHPLWFSHLGRFYPIPWELSSHAPEKPGLVAMMLIFSEEKLRALLSQYQITLNQGQRFVCPRANFCS